MPKRKSHKDDKYKQPLIEEKVIYQRIRNGKLEIVHGTVRKRPDGTFEVVDDTGKKQVLDYKLETALYSVFEFDRPENHDYFSEFGRKYIGNILKFNNLVKEARKLNKEQLIEVAQQFIDKVIKEDRLEKTYNSVVNFLKGKIPQQAHMYMENDVRKYLEQDIINAKKNFKSFIENPQNFVVKKEEEVKYLYKGVYPKKRTEVTIGSVRGRMNGEGYAFFSDSRSKHPEIMNMIQTLKYIHSPEVIDNFISKLTPLLYKMKQPIYKGIDENEVKRYKDSLGDILEKNPDRPVVFINLPKTIYKMNEKDFTDYLVEKFTKHLREYDRKEKGFRDRKHIAIYSSDYSDGKTFEAKQESKFKRTQNIEKYYGEWNKMAELGLIRKDVLKAKIPKDAIVIVVDDTATTGASVQSFIDFIGDTIGRKDYEGIYSLVLHNNNYKDTITDPIRKEYSKKSHKKKRRKS